MSPIRGILLATMLGVFASLAAQEIWVNCGGEEYYDRFGRYFLPDVEYSAAAGYGYMGGGEKSFTYGSVHYMPEKYDRELLHTRHSGKEFEYLFDIPSGRYVVTFYFCDHYGRFKESFPFDVSGEDNTLLENFSIFDEAGRLHLIIHRYLIEVSDNQLNLDFQGRYWGRPWPTAQIVALGVLPLDTTAPLPAPPDEFEIIPSYGMNALIWAHSGKQTVAGYNLYISEGGTFTRLNDSTIHSARYFDREVTPYKSYTYYVTSVDVRGGEGKPSKELSGIPLDSRNSRLPYYSLEIIPEKLDTMWQSIYSDEYTPCTFCYQDAACSAGVRFRGNHERTIGTKMAWKIRFPNVHPVIGERKLNLKSESADPSLLREGLYFTFSQDLQFPTIRRQYVHLEVNGEYRGVFLQKEQIEKQFLQHLGLDENGSVYKVWNGNLTPCEHDSIYRKEYYKETGDLDDYSDLIAFIVLIDTTPQSSLPTALSDNLDLGNFASWYGLNNVVGAVDYHCRNHYLCKETNGKWRFISWDFDLSFLTSSWDWRIHRGIETFSTGTAVNPLFARFLSVPAFRLAYCNRVYQFLSLSFTDENTSRRIDSLYQLIEIDGACDLWKGYAETTSHFPAMPDSLTMWCSQRRAYLLSEGIEKSMPPRSTTLRINEIASQPEAWVELINTGEENIDLSSFKLDIDLGQSGRWGLPDTVLRPKDVLLLTESDGAIPSLSPQGGELVIFDAAGEPVDAVFYDYITPGSSLGRKGKGSDRWTIFPNPTPGKVNPEEKCRFTVTPNLFAQSTTIRIELLQPGDYSVAVYNQVGRRVNLILREDNGTLFDEFIWEAKDDVGRPLPAGVYFLLVFPQNENFLRQKIVVLR